MKMKRFIGRVVRLYNKIIHSNLFLRIVSILLGIIVWFSIINVVNPQNETVVKVPVQIDMTGSIPEHYGLSLLNQDEPIYTTVKVKGPRTNIFTFDNSEITATANLSSVTEAGTYSIDIQVRSDDNNLEIVSVEPASVFLEFDKIVTRSFDIALDITGEVADGYVLTDSQVYPKTVDIKGPENVVTNISRVYIPVNIENKTEGQKATSEVIIENTDGTLADKTKLTLSSETVSYSYDIYYTKTLPLSIDLKNDIGGDESSYTKVEISPQNVTVYGEKSVLDAMTEVKLDNVISLDSITGKSQAYVFTLPENETFSYLPGQDLTANVTVTFDSSVRTQIYTLSKSRISKFAFVNLPDGKTATIKTSSLQVPVRSLPSYLTTISSASINGTIDFSQQNDKGQYLVNISIDTSSPYGITQRIYVDVDLS